MIGHFFILLEVFLDEAICFRTRPVWMGQLRQSLQTDALNQILQTDPEIYYFSIPCSATQKDENGNHVPLKNQMEPLFVRLSCQIGAYLGKLYLRLLTMIDKLP